MEISPRQTKKRKQEHPEKMSRSDPVVIEDDDESIITLPSSTIGKGARGLSSVEKTPGRSPLNSRKDLVRQISVTEFSGVEDLVNPRRALRRPNNERRVSQASDELANGFEEDFTLRAAFQRRQEQEQNTATPARRKVKSPPLVESGQTRNVFTAGDGRKRNSVIGSPDVLQGAATVVPTTSPVANQTKNQRKSETRQSEQGENTGLSTGPTVRGALVHHFQCVEIDPPDNGDYILTVQEGHLALWSLGSRLSSDPVYEILLRNINSVNHGGKSIQLILKSPPMRARQAYIELHTEREVRNITNKLASEGPHIKINQKPTDWVERAEKGYDMEREKERATRIKAQQTLSKSEGARHDLEHQVQIRRNSVLEKESAKIQDKHEELKSTDAMQKRDAHQRRPLKEILLAFPEDSSDKEVNGASARRTTRSTKAEASPRLVKEASVTESQIPFSQTGGLGPAWKKPLIYPKSGKKRAEVEFRDLERLDDNEFLNDNLIGFFLRFLEADIQQHRPELAQKIYFFNTYFFATLTNASRAKKGIYYEGVQKWTRGTNIFEHDFIIVPINENAHWYVAIICNLPKLLPGAEEAEEAENDEAAPEPGHPSPDESSSPRVTRVITRIDDPMEEAQDEVPGRYPSEIQIDETDRSFKDLNLADNGVLSNVVDQGQSDVNKKGSLLSTWASKPGDQQNLNTQQSPRKSPKGKKAARRSGVGLQKYDTKAPMIITMDSLGLGRSPTTKALRDYIVDEAKAKLKLDIDGQRIRGMTAKGIPNQENYSDCGLYLLAYMEKFILDPYGFVGSILERKMDDREDWPVMESSNLRDRLRKFLLDFHERQENGESAPPAVNVGRILLGEPRRKGLVLGQEQTRESGTTSRYFDGISSLETRKTMEMQQGNEAPKAELEPLTAISDSKTETSQIMSAITIDSDQPSQQPAASTLGDEQEETDKRGNPVITTVTAQEGPDLLDAVEGSFEDEVPETIQGDGSEGSFEELVPEQHEKQ